MARRHLVSVSAGFQSREARQQLLAFWLGVLFGATLGVIIGYEYVNGVGEAFRNGLTFEPIRFWIGGLVGALIGTGIGAYLTKDDGHTQRGRQTPKWLRIAGPFANTCLPCFLLAWFGAALSCANLGFSVAFPSFA